MKKSLSIGLSMIASILLIFVIVFTALQQVINNETFVNNEFTKLEVADAMGMNNADLVDSMMVLIGYMEGDADSLDIMVTVNGQKVQMFDLDQEREHMVDVRQIYQTVRSYRDTALLALVVLFLFAAVVNFKRSPQSLAQGFLFGAFVMLVIFGFIGTWAAMDFSSFWTFFHEALFWNDLWLFDATESRMINMLPEKMFSDIVGRMGIYAGAAVAALIGLSVVTLVLTGDRYKQAHADAKERAKQRQAYRESRAALKEEQRREAEKARRIAEKKAAREAARQKADEEAEKERLAAEKAEAAARTARERAAAKRQKAAAQRPVEDRPAQTPKPSASGTTHAAPAKKKPAAAAKPKKKARGNVVDDTGFFDE